MYGIILLDFNKNITEKHVEQPLKYEFRYQFPSQTFISKILPLKLRCTLYMEPFVFI